MDPKQKRSDRQKEENKDDFSFRKNRKDLIKSSDAPPNLGLFLEQGKRQDMAGLSHLFSEDMRISKILRRLCLENNPQLAIELCEKLEVVIMDSSNAAYIRRSFDFLAESLISILQQGPVESLEYVAKVFGLLGYVIRHDFDIFKNWIFNSYDNHKSIRINLMHALKITLMHDADDLDITSYSERLIVSLKTVLECADVAANFLSISDVIAQFSKNYKKTFEKHFVDIVDIVVGWHLETDQLPKLKQHCSDVLQQFSTFFIREIDFSLGLLGQFLEDISGFGEDLEHLKNKEEPSSKSSVSPDISIGSFIGSFNSVLKCLSYDPFIISSQAGKQVLEDALYVITKVAQQSLEITANTKIVLPINEFYILILTCSNSNHAIDLKPVAAIIQLQINLMHNFIDEEISSLLLFLLTFVREFKSNIPVELVFALLEPKDSYLWKLKLMRNKTHIRCLVLLYQEILMVKNVPLLQEAYKYILCDIRNAMSVIKNEGICSYSLPQAETILNFYIIAISNLATQTSSIIGLYALQPSILELLITDLSAGKVDLWSKSPLLHDSILNLTAIHCMKNNNYLLSSNLMISNVFSKLSLDDVSPTSENFTTILKFLSEISSDLNLATKSKLQILVWINSLFRQCSTYGSVLVNNEYFTQIGKNICAMSIDAEKDIALECCICNNSLLEYETINYDILQTIAEVCYMHMCSTDNEIRKCYSDVFGKLPLEISLRIVYKTTGYAKMKANKMSDILQWYFSSSVSGNMKEKFFKNFILKSEFDEPVESIQEYIKDIFIKCWTNQSAKTMQFFMLAINDTRCLTAWAQWESARYCVNSKLRTSLGKPQDTFLKIEAVIKNVARILTLKESSSTDKNIQSLLSYQKHACILIGFLEILEKAIYNASEGTAFAMQSPEKPVRTFFRVNATTCNEWFNRIRGAVNLIALHCMEPETVIRHSEFILRGLVASNRISDTVFEQTLVTYARALLKNSEADMITGLYVWGKAISGKKFMWLKMATEQAANSRERAVEGYMMILCSEEKVESYIREFIHDQITTCLYSAHKMPMLKNLLQQQTFSTSSQENISLEMQALQNDIFSMCEISEPCLGLSDWGSIEQSENISNNISVTNFLSVAEDSLEQFVLNPMNFDENKFKLSTDIIQSSIQECLRTKSKAHVNHLIVLNYIACKILPRKMEGNNIPNIDVEKFHGFDTLVRILRWLEYSSYFLPNDSSRNDNLQLKVISIARKEGNKRFCCRELEIFFKRANIGTLLNSQNDEYNLTEICLALKENTKKSDFWSNNVLRGVYETSKCLFTFPGKLDEAIQLSSSGCLAAFHKINSDQTAEKKDETSMLIAKMLFKLSEWLPQATEITLNDNNQSPLKELLDFLPDTECSKCDQIKTVVPTADMASGKLIENSVQQCTDLAEAWCALGNWFYRWGRKAVELKTNSAFDKSDLRPDDILYIKALIPEATEQTVEQILAVLNRHKIIVDDEEMVASEVNSTEFIEIELRKIEALALVSRKIIESVIQIWKQAHKNVYRYYEISAEAYFKYLALVSSDSNQQKISCDTAADGASSVVTATLRLLRLIVKHAMGLQDVLEEGLATTPTKPWKVIIPQLFSRLNHHEPYVRKRVSELLCRVAKDAAHLIIFPAVVGAAQQNNSLYQLSVNNPITENNENVMDNALTLCFDSLLSTLSKQAPETVEQVQLLVRELKRVTLFWDELWLHSLAQLYGEYFELFNSFEAEIHKTAEDKIDSLAEKHKTLMANVIKDIERMNKITSRTPETNYERTFQERYSKVIETTISDLKKPFNIKKPNESWHKIKQLYMVLQQRLQKSSQSTLKMADISPVLANMKSTVISMPGVEMTASNPIYIYSVDNIVYILPTKTKPKKLAFFGSDGKRYTYLFKGLEDLHLDERIMQFLSIANSMMSRESDKKRNDVAYRAHYYSVIPLGPTSGLISWVDGVIPIFSLYKKWQQREAANPKKDKPFNAMRPSEMFYNKLTPLLAEHDIKITDNRKTWPLPVLRSVLEQLTKETPRDLLAKELWCHSSDSAAWWRVTRTYSLSVAVMSVIGYVIGLGDRHLDNVLVKLSTGEIVHIDYNVCFEKGKTLRVPEKVPFRMTPNLEEALGVTGIEGIFRMTSEHVLKTLRKERETLLTLLEAFVYDPLVDWAVNDDGTTNTSRTTAIAAAADAATTVPGLATSECSALISNSEKRYRRKKLRDTLSTRFSEIKPEWIQYRNDINDQLLQIEKCLDDLIEHQKQLVEDEFARNLLSKQVAMVEEVEALGTAMSSHALNTVSHRYGMLKKAKKEYQHIKQKLSEKCDNISRTTEFYIRTIYQADKIDNREINSEIKRLRSFPLGNELELVSDLLESVGKTSLYSEAFESYIELDKYFSQQLNNIEFGAASIDHYRRIIRLCPKQIVLKGKCLKYEECCRELLNNPDKYQQVIQIINALVNDKNDVDPIMANKAILYNKELQKEVDGTQSEMQKMREKIELESKDNNEERYNDIREAISIFLQEETGSKCALMCSLLLLLCNIKQQFTEKPSFITADPDKIYTSFVNDTQLTNLTVISGLIQVLNLETGVETRKLNEIIECLISIVSDLRSIELQLSMPVLRKLVELKLLDNFEIIAAMTKISELKDVFSKKDINSMEEYYKQMKAELNKIDQATDLFDVIDITWSNISLNINKLFEILRRLTETREFSNDDFLEIHKIIVNNFDYNYIKHLQDEIIFIKYQMLISVFHYSLCVVESMQENKLSSIFKHTDLQMVISKPIIQYSNLFVFDICSHAAYLVQYNILDQMNVGVKPFTVEAIRTNVINKYVTNGVFSKTVFTYSETICSNLKATLQKTATIKNINQIISVQTNVSKFLNDMAAAHSWANNNKVSSNPQPHPFCKNTILLTIQTALNILKTCQVTIQQLSSKQKDLIESIMKHLELTTNHGPNQNLQTIQIFNDRINAHEQKIKCQNKLCCDIIELCLAITRYESWDLESTDTSSTSTTGSESELLSLILQYSKSYNTLKTANLEITQVEEALVQLLDPEGYINHTWIDNASQLLDDMTDTIQKKIISNEKHLNFYEDILQMGAINLQSLLTGGVRTDVRCLLKLIFKVNDGEHRMKNKDLQKKYKEFLDHASEMHIKLSTKDFTSDIIGQIRDLVHLLLIELDDMYNNVLKYMVDRISANDGAKCNEDIAICGTPTKESRRANQPEQKRNAYAVSVWRRIRMKLEGRDPDPTRRLTVAEQIEWTIREATNPDNLAVLYEGWTPWV